MLTGDHDPPGAHRPGNAQPTFLGEWAVISEWGRIDRGGTVRSTPPASQAKAARDRRWQIRQPLGYSQSKFRSVPWGQ